MKHLCTWVDYVYIHELPSNLIGSKVSNLITEKSKHQLKYYWKGNYSLGAMKYNWDEIRL